MVQPLPFRDGDVVVLTASPCPGCHAWLQGAKRRLQGKDARELISSNYDLFSEVWEHPEGEHA